MNNVMLNLIQHLMSLRVKPGVVIILAIIAFGLDRLTKIYLPVQKYYNDGAAFGMLEGHTSLLAVFSAVVLVSLIIFTIKKNNTLCNFQKIGLGLLMGGIVGNLYDRVVFGHVIDFIDIVFINFPVFNLADVFINTGAGILLIALLFRK